MKNKVPERIRNIERMLYVKAIRLANEEPTEIREINELHQKLVAWMNGEEKQ